MRSISRRAWQRAVTALLWYPDNKKEYASLLDDLMTKHPKKAEENSIHADPTADMAILLSENRRFQMLKQEIEAVEIATSTLRPEQIEVIRRRFWEPRKYSGGRRKPRQYDFLQGEGYSIGGMRKIVKTVVVVVAEYLGEK